MTSTTRIEERIPLKAPVSRVWRAISDPREFGRWFGVELDGPFVEGRAVPGAFSQEFDEAGILEYQRKLGLPPSKIRIPAAGETFCTIERMEPESYFSFRWIPYGIDAGVDPRSEPTTLVEFRLESTSDGTELTIVESGFEWLPAERQRRAFLMNSGGWSAQAENLRRFVEGTDLTP